MKNNNVPLALIVAAALLGLTQENADANMSAPDFTPLESLNAQQRIAIQTEFESVYPAQAFNWDQSMVGVNANGEIEVRDKNSFVLQAVGAPTCAD